MHHRYLCRWCCILACPPALDACLPSALLVRCGADLADLSAAELLAKLAPVLPAIRRHLDAGGPLLEARGWHVGQGVWKS